MSDFGTFHATTEPWISRAARSKYGDPTRDAAVFERYSPLVHAAHVRAPLTLVHGANDTSVPPSESEQMASAVTAAGGARASSSSRAKDTTSCAPRDGAWSPRRPAMRCSTRWLPGTPASTMPPAATSA